MIRKFLQVRDGDTGIPRPVELSLVGDKLQYFSLVTRGISPDGTLTASLVTSDNVIDRENSDVLKEGGLYPFQVQKIHTKHEFPKEIVGTNFCIFV